ncbi:MAG: DsrE family protein [Gammaproteobacteria bacterium]|nr:DsrE family protein [Gammaproteobacteria bacterium]
MKMKKLLAIATATVMMLGTGLATAGSYSKQKVAYHVNYDNAKRQSGAMRNIQNHINAVGAENLDLRIIMHGKGVSLLMKANSDANFESKVVSLKSQNVAFKVCKNTLRGKKIDYKSDLFDVDESDIVPSGVAELAHLQQKGFAYIRP